MRKNSLVTHAFDGATPACAHRRSIGMPSFDSTPTGSEKVSGPCMEKT
jgi:hypothetical protein